MSDLELIIPFTSVLLFFLGLSTTLLKRNAVAVMLGIELMLNAAGLNFVFFARIFNDANPLVFYIFIIGIAAAETTVLLALIYRYYQVNKTADLTKPSDEKI